jgi:hypothetical protein
MSLKKLNILFFVSIFTLGVQFFLPKNVEAACRCVCVDGKYQNLCSSTMDLKKNCFGLCPLTPPSLKPLTPLGTRPLGTTSCTMKQVWNSWTNSYQWQKVCS